MRFITVILLILFDCCSLFAINTEAKPVTDANANPKLSANANLNANSTARATDRPKYCVVKGPLSANELRCEKKAQNNSFLHFNDHCFVVDSKCTHGSSWDDNRELCAKLDAKEKQSRMAYVEDEDIMGMLKAWLKRIYGDEMPRSGGWWIALLQVDIRNEPARGWAWMNNDRTVNKWANDIKWKGDQPDNNGDCANLWYDYRFDTFGINDDHCQSSYPAICQIVPP